MLTSIIAIVSFAAGFAAACYLLKGGRTFMEVLRAIKDGIPK